MIGPLPLPSARGTVKGTGTARPAGSRTCSPPEVRCCGQRVERGVLDRQVVVKITVWENVPVVVWLSGGAVVRDAGCGAAMSTLAAARWAA
jgi:hypothetical protein